MKYKIKDRFVYLKIIDLIKLFSTTFCLITSFIITAQSQGQRQNIIFTGDFETGNTSQWDEEEGRGTKTVVTSPVRAGTYALKAEVLRSQDNNNWRTEVKIFNAGGPGLERWYGWSNMLPTDWINDPMKSGDIIAQFHDRPDSLDRCNPAEPFKIPPLYLIVSGNEISWVNRWDPNPCTPKRGGQSATLWRAPIVKGEWVDWVLHVKWSYGQDGLLEIWRNGEKIVTKNGPNCYNDLKQMTFKLGNYKSEWENTNILKRTVWQDEFRMGNELATYSDVVPDAGTGSTPTPTNTPTPTPTSEPVPTNYLEDFNDGVANGWSVVSPTWDIITDGTKVYHTTPNSGLARTVYGKFSWNNYVISSKVKVTSWGSTTQRTVGMLTRYNDTNNYYIVVYELGQLLIKRKLAGTQTVIASKSFDFNLGEWYDFKVVASGSKHLFYINGNLELSATDDSIKTGKLGLLTVRADARFDDVTINPANPPVARCKPITVDVGNSCSANITPDDINNGSSDPDGDNITLSLDSAGPYGLGDYTVTLTATDSLDLSSSCNSILTVVDETLPSISVPADITYECIGNVPTANVTDAIVSDNCDEPTVTIAETDNGGAGSVTSPLIITRIYTATDTSGNSSSARQTITVIDDIPPVITGERVSKTILWPPNHKMVDVVVNYNTTDNCDSSDITNILNVVSNESDNGKGDGNSTSDWEIIDNHRVRLRAERAGNGNGRIYTITITSIDSKGNSSSKSVLVTVPHNNGN